ncbi:hypothetical protein MTBPR1_10067 [Candidatus Terasakiella magnetica]|uniref:Uncharacterized protein n=1 Tax=Candidatus Terasakiella magnetica TaxID=1867952 RepID=A0A1C3RC28_9PROT|nr:hypothetical protein MTBPR1_10067 [Candidatus Terasakiella magnetica]
MTWKQPQIGFYCEKQMTYKFYLNKFSQPTHMYICKKTR